MNYSPYISSNLVAKHIHKSIYCFLAFFDYVEFIIINIDYRWFYRLTIIEIE